MRIPDYLTQLLQPTHMAAMPQLLLPVLVALPAASAAVFDVTDRAAKARVLGSHVYDPRGTRPPSRTDPLELGRTTLSIFRERAVGNVPTLMPGPLARLQDLPLLTA
jgi:hypothetical protein